jgi:esterase
MQRRSFKHDGLTFSYLDSGGDAQPLVALHAHWMEGLTFAPLAAALAPQWRVFALDQRGHGQSDHARSYTRDDYLDDVSALFAHLGLQQAVLLGNSLGGVNAYQFAARHPDRVRALIIEDIGVEVTADMPYVQNWGGVFATRKDLSERIGARMLPYLQDSFRLTPDGWRLAFEPQEMIASQANLAGDHWKDWLATECPALLIRGRNSIVTNPEQLEQMAHRRGNTVFRILDGGHVVHFDNPDGFTTEVQSFLHPLP